MTAGESTLLIDMGNSRVKWALANESTRDVGEPFANRGSDTDFSLLDTVPRPAKIVVANTAGEACASIFSAWCNRVWGLAPQFLKSPARQGGLRNSYADPQALGVDRWLAMVAARQTREGAFAVVDCGTAITVDAVSSDGDFLGGVISAGPATSLRALTNSVNIAPTASEKGENRRCHSVFPGSDVGRLRFVKVFLSIDFDSIYSSGTVT